MYGTFRSSYYKQVISVALRKNKPHSVLLFRWMILNSRFSCYIFTVDILYDVISYGFFSLQSDPVLISSLICLFIILSEAL